MPSMITHYLLAEDAYFNLNNNLSNIIKDNYQTFSIGSNGPDIFFYYNCFPWLDQNKAKEVINYGSQIHAYKINEFFEALLKNVKLLNNESSIAHTAGLLCHWAMDKVCHPYIFYKTNGQPLSKYYHRQFESTLDTLVLKHYKHLTPASFKGYKLLVHDDKIADGILKVYQHPLKKVHNLNLTFDEVKRSLSHFYKSQKLLYDPKGTKKKYAEQIENKIIKFPYAFSSMIVPKDYHINLDIMNESKHVWLHPTTGVKHNESLYDLYELSKKTAIKVLELFNDYLTNDDLTQILAYINNQSFETGLGYYDEFKYSLCIYKP